MNTIEIIKSVLVIAFFISAIAFEVYLFISTKRNDKLTREYWENAKIRQKIEIFEILKNKAMTETEKSKKNKTVKATKTAKAVKTRKTKNKESEEK